MALSYKAKRRWALVILVIGLPVYIVVAAMVMSALDRPPILVELLIYAVLGVLWALPFKVVFKGAPLPKVKVQLAAPSGWTREAETAEDGTVHFATPWKGQYVAEVKHSDKTPGEAQGEKYGEASYVTTLSFVLAEGMVSPALPAPPTGH